MSGTSEMRLSKRLELLQLSYAVVAETVSKGLKVERIIFSNQKRWHGRCVEIERKPCQIVRARYAPPNPLSPKANSIRIYLPRTEWPDFVIYVVRHREKQQPPEYYIVPRGVLSKDTGMCPSSLTEYRDAWHLLRDKLPAKFTDRRFAGMNWQLQAAIAAAERAGLEVNLVSRGSPRPLLPYCQTRLIVAGRRCIVRSLNINSGYAAVQRAKGDWGEFQLYVLPDSKEVYVIPSVSMKVSTLVSLQNERLKAFLNKWDLLTQPAGEAGAIDWNCHKSSMRRISGQPDQSASPRA